MEDRNEVNLGECIEIVTGRSVGLRLDEYVYIDTKEKVEDENIIKAKELKSKLEKELLVPKNISPRQAREIIIRIGLFNTVETYINNIEDETERLIARNYWEYSEVFERNHPVLLTLVSALGITDEQLDNMFIEASKL
jgi:hypothetical protein